LKLKNNKIKNKSRQFESQRWKGHKWSRSKMLLDRALIKYWWVSINFKTTKCLKDLKTTSWWRQHFKKRWWRHWLEGGPHYLWNLIKKKSEESFINEEETSIKITIAKKNSKFSSLRPGFSPKDSSESEEWDFFWRMAIFS